MSTQTQVNPLLLKQEYCAYSQIKAEHVVPAAKEVINEAQKILDQTLALLDSNEKLSFTNVMMPLIEMEEIIDNAWTPVQNMLSLVGEKDIRDAADEARPLIVDFYNNYSMNEKVYDLVKKYSQTDEAKALSGEYKRYLEDTVKDFVLSGAELSDSDKEIFKEINLELSDLSQKFSNNVTDSKFELIITDEKDLSGLPEDIIKMAQAKADELRLARAKKNDEEMHTGADVQKEHAQNEEHAIPEKAWVFTLDYPSYGPFMKFSDRGDLRKKLYIEYLSKATSGDRNNDELIKKIFNGKKKRAHMLGFKNYAELSIESKMADSPEQVKSFLERLAVKSKPLAEQEYAHLVKFQKEINYQNTENNPEIICPWDKTYLEEKLRKKEFEFDTNLTKPYFELFSTMKGMFNIAETLFDIKIKKVSDIEVWHEDVEVYQLNKSSGDKIGTLYVDNYPRDTKRQGAWMMPLVQGCQLEDGSYRHPQCVISCNLTKPMADTPSLLTHMETLTLFHEFGHALHHLLTTAQLAPMAGTSVEWDFVELPSQLFENFAWEKESLVTFAKHYKTGEAIPDELLNKMLKARNFNEGLACIRQLEFGLFDLAVYMRNEDDGRSPNDIFKDICNQYGVFPVVEGTNFPNSFGHIFCGGYSAGYYSYKWAEVLEADAFSKFQKAGVINKEVGIEYRDKILAQGDTKAPGELFKDFMGREPNENALLERMGL